MKTVRDLFAALLILLVSAAAAPATAAPEGQMTWGVHISLAPTWFDPAETPGIGTPFMILYALHDALVKPMPGNAMAPSLAESWSVSKDGLVYEFVLRAGARFHNGEPVTADDVKFSFERYRGAAARLMKEKVAAVEVADPGRVRFRFREPWPDFMTYYGSLATGAGWIVPRKYLEKVGDDGFKKAPVGAGPYRFVSFNPGVELVLEAYEPYWRKSPSLKRLVLKAVPDETTRLAMLNRGGANARPASLRQALTDYLQAVGIRVKLRPLERAAFFKAYQEKTLKNLVYSISGAFGNAAIRVENFVAAGGPYVYGSYPDIDGLFREQSGELDRKRREAMLHRIQQLIHEKAMYAPIWELGFIHAQGPRVAESGLGLITGWAFSAPYEDVKLKGK